MMLAELLTFVLVTPLSHAFLRRNVHGVANISDVISNMLRAWDYFKSQIRQPDFTLEDLQTAEIWADPQVTADEMPLALMSIVSKALLELGITRVVELWDTNTSSWKLPHQVFDDPSLRIRNNFLHLTTRLKKPMDLPAVQSRFFRISNAATDAILNELGKTMQNCMTWIPTIFKAPSPTQRSNGSFQTYHVVTKVSHLTR